MCRESYVEERKGRNSCIIKCRVWVLLFLFVRVSNIMLNGSSFWFYIKCVSLVLVVSSKFCNKVKILDGLVFL